MKILDKEIKEGAVERAKNDIYKTSEAWFGDVPENIRHSIMEITDFKRLSLIVRKSVTVKDFDEFREYLK